MLDGVVPGACVESWKLFLQCTSWQLKISNPCGEVKTITKTAN